MGGACADTIDFDCVRALHDGAALGFEPAPGAHRVAALFHTGGTTGMRNFLGMTECACVIPIEPAGRPHSGFRDASA